ncbi:MAG: serine/threonine protein kinase, partial [Burkholderiaceae bacterium]|nr:serine/threonine protein kinase [Burkholderiaceae bacterium]
TAAAELPAAPATAPIVQTDLPPSPAATRSGPSRLARAPGAPAEKGVVVFAVAPWGEVFVNGSREGTTPPLAQLTLPAGRHTIELRNGQRPAYVAQVDVAPGRPQRISHLFQ